MPITKTDLVRQAGYTKDDFLPVLPLLGDNNGGSTSSSSYQNVLANLVFTRIKPSDILPTTAQPQAVLFARGEPNGDQIDIRLRDTGNGQTIVERTGVTSPTNFDKGPVDWNPSDRDITTDIRVEARNSDGTTSVTATKVTAIIGVALT